MSKNKQRRCHQTFNNEGGRKRRSSRLRSSLRLVKKDSMRPDSNIVRGGHCVYESKGFSDVECVLKEAQEHQMNSCLQLRRYDEYNWNRAPCQVR